MKNSYSLINGWYELIFRDKKTKNVEHKIRGHNLITYQGADILAKLLSGNIAYKIGYIYGEHAPDGTYGPSHGLTPSRSDTVDSMEDIGVGRTSENARVPVIYPGFNADINYNNNIVNFSASFSDAILDNRQFVGIGLVAKVGATDLLFSHDYYPTKLKAVNHEIVVVYSVQFI